MSHDTEAAFSSSEIAYLIAEHQSDYFGSERGHGWSLYAGRASGRGWPIADGIIEATHAQHGTKRIAFEYKRVNEGSHGVLTALGQSLAYLEKGYDAVAIAVPNTYGGQTDATRKLVDIIKLTAPHLPISVYAYDTPDFNLERPFKGHLACIRDICLQDCTINAHTPVQPLPREAVSTLWAHMREGDSVPDAFFRFCQTAKILSSYTTESQVILPKQLKAAAKRLSPPTDPVKYLSCTSGDTLSDRVWRYVWFTYYLHPKNAEIFKREGTTYTVVDEPTKIQHQATKNKVLFSSRRDSIKQKLVDKLNSGQITEEKAWEDFAKVIHDNAHSYREIMDSGLYQIGFIEDDAHLTGLGYKFVDACEAYGTPWEGYPFEIFKAAILEKGQYKTLLHYIHNYSQHHFETHPNAFLTGNAQFDSTAYKQWLYKIFTEELHIIKTETGHSTSGTRQPFQAELTMLNKLGLLSSSQYKAGIGLVINWPKVLESQDFYRTLGC